MNPDLSKLSDEELNQRLAEHLGWTFHDIKYAPKCGGAVFEKFWLRPGVNIADLTAEDIGREGASVPRYCTDLNAVAAVEAGLTREQCHAYQDTLLEIVREESPLCSQCEAGEAPWSKRWTWHASSNQRTRALIATLEP